MRDTTPVTLVEKHERTYSGLVRKTVRDTGTEYRTLSPSEGIKIIVHIPTFDVDDDPTKKMILVHIDEMVYRSTQTLEQTKETVPLKQSD
jgi:hypothetical protein